MSYAIVWPVCATGLLALLHLTTLATAGAALAAGAVAWRSWRQVREDWRLDISGTGGPIGFLALFVVLANGLFRFLILLEGVPNIVLNPCV